MKIGIICLIIVFCIITLMAVSNPSTDEFFQWYQYNYENRMEADFRHEIDATFETDNDILQIFIDGVKELFAKDKIDDIVEKYLKSYRNKIQINRSLLFTDYTIFLPDGTNVRVRGLLNSFSVISEY